MITGVLKFLGIIGRIAYTVWAWLAFAVAVIVALFFALFVPGLDRRRRGATASGRLFFLLAGIPSKVSGLDNHPDGHCIVVANHSSYLDGVILNAFLPPRFSFVVKGEMQKVPVMHFLLRRMGSQFVERFVAAGCTRDARRLVKAAASGESLAFLPEGTFIKEPGLGRFRPGAFAAAIKGEMPVVPVSIRGSRDILPAGTLAPRPGQLIIDILPAINASDEAQESSANLARKARSAILEVLDEPDLLPATATE
jgi:1-acyl-sn-glycerol-3-phosphate acyltransferase